MVRVYGMAESGNCYKVKLLLSQLRQPFEWIETDIMQGLTRKPAFLEMNPNGKVPTLEIEPGVFLPESNAILCYLAEGSPYWPSDRLARLRARGFHARSASNRMPKIESASGTANHST